MATKAVAKSTTKPTTKTRRTANPEEVCVQARWASADCTGAHGSGAVFNVTASAKVDGRDLVIYGGNVEMSRDRTVQTAFTMLEAVAMMRGLTDADRQKLREIAASTPLFGPSPAELVAG